MQNKKRLPNFGQGNSPAGGFRAPPSAVPGSTVPREGPGSHRKCLVRVEMRGGQGMVRAAVRVPVENPYPNTLKHKDIIL
jgi:hypothetical protein